MVRSLPAFKLIWPLVVLLALGASPQVAAAAAGHLATPEALQADVVFWEQVFSKYTPDDCILHDRDHLGMIYAVKHLGSSEIQKTFQIRRALSSVRDAIRSLASGEEARTELERHIVSVTPAKLRFPAYYRYAASNVRCQRGVDLQPSLARSKAHLSMVKRVLQAQHVPVDLAYLPHLESGYNPQALSRVGARGIWQFMPATARLFRLGVSRRADLRINPLRSTQAAAEMLQSFYAQTDSWPLAITAYNYGINGIMRAIKLYGHDYVTVRDKHRTAVFGFASRNYYPSFLAVRNVAAKEEGLALNQPRRSEGRGLVF